MKCSMHAGKAYSVKHNERDFDKEKWNNYYTQLPGW